MEVFKVIWCQEKGGPFFDFIFINRVKVSHHFTVGRLMSSPSSFASGSFLFMKEMNMDELIQFVRSFILVLMDIDNSENELISHTSQSSSFSSTHTLQEDAPRTQLQIEASPQPDQP